jgi:hypothetical protein
MGYRDYLRSRMLRFLPWSIAGSALGGFRTHDIGVALGVFAVVEVFFFLLFSLLWVLVGRTLNTVVSSEPRRDLTRLR